MHTDFIVDVNIVDCIGRWNPAGMDTQRTDCNAEDHIETTDERWHQTMQMVLRPSSLEITLPSTVTKTYVPCHRNGLGP